MVGGTRMTHLLFALSKCTFVAVELRLLLCKTRRLFDVDNWRRRHRRVDFVDLRWVAAHRTRLTTRFSTCNRLDDAVGSHATNLIRSISCWFDIVLFCCCSQWEASELEGSTCKASLVCVTRAREKEIFGTEVDTTSKRCRQRAIKLFELDASPPTRRRTESGRKLQRARLTTYLWPLWALRFARQKWPHLQHCCRPQTRTLFKTEQAS